MVRRTQEQYEATLPKDRTYQVLGTYAGAKARIEVKCNVCDHTWYPQAGKLTGGTGCPLCWQTERSARSMRRYDYLARLRETDPVTCQDCIYKGSCTIADEKICPLFKKGFEGYADNGNFY